ncbi:MAG: DUF1127 domain-containing protein [Rhodobacteraceae bacterium]|nr:DUF1127 domain-containing protein [Paracoccaceae bacterium]
MTTITYRPTRPGVFADAEQVANGWLTQLHGALAARRVYRRTLAELRALSMRQREDIGIAGLDEKPLARAASRLA